MGKKVLLVDDVSMFVELQKEYLQNSAVEILTARDGQEAFRICQAEHPILVCMDLHMPIMNGAECCKALKEHRHLNSTKVILITSEGKPADRALCLAAGCDEFLTKPLDRNVFLDAARRLLPAIERRDKRVACHLKVKYRASGVTLAGYLVNLSLHGAYLATDQELDQGTILDLIFVLPEPYGAIVQIRGRVAWLNTSKVRQKQGLVEGVGVEFLLPAEDALQELTRFVENEPSII